MFFLALLFACGNETTAASSAPPPAENSEVANILAGLQSGETPDPTPTDQEPPAVPEEVTERAPPEPAASGSTGRTDSPACKAARSERESHQAKIDSYREKDVVAAEARWLQAEDAKNWCAGDLAGCATDGEKFKEYNIAAQVAQKAYEDAQFRVGELEAAFYNIDQEILAACGSSRQ